MKNENDTTTERGRKMSLVIQGDYTFIGGDGVEDAYLEKKRMVKLFESIKETTPELLNFQIVMRERRGEKSSDISKMRFRRN